MSISIKNLFFIVFFIPTKIILPQNLILNGGYEQFDYCKCIDGSFNPLMPSDINPKLQNITFTTGVANIPYTIGFYSTLSTNLYNGSSTWCTDYYKAPITPFGSRLPHSGNNFVLMPWAPPGINNGHFFKLSQPLIVGAYYTIEFWIACGSSTLALRNNDTLPQITLSPFENAHFNFSKTSDYSNWVKLSSCIKATANIDSISIYSNIFGFLDDVTLHPAQHLQIAVSDTVGCGEKLQTVFTPINLGSFNSFIWCFGDNTTGNSSTIFTHQFSLPNSYNTLLIARDTILGTYGCYTQQFMGGNPVADFKHDSITITINSTYTNTSTHAESYDWFLNGTSLSQQKNLQLTINNEGNSIICLKATDKLGCKDTVCKSVNVFLCDQITDANIFTPNDDGINDVFYFFKTEPCEPKNIKISIFNRWGKIVYEYPNDYLIQSSSSSDTSIFYKNFTHNYKYIYTYKFWNGITNNTNGEKICDDGVYFLIIETPKKKKKTNNHFT